jgi:TRAP-type C4-dicarboxylate transport system permease small subunit
MGRRRKKTTTENLFDVLFDITDLFWQVGAVVSTVLMFVSFAALDWATDQYIKASASPHLGQLTESYGWVIFLIPLMIAGIAFMFGVKAYQSFCREYRY